MIIADKFIRQDRSPKNHINLITDYVNIENELNRSERKKDNFVISPKTQVGNLLGPISDLHNIEKSPSLKINLKSNSKLILFDDISSNSKSTKNNLGFNQVSGKLENIKINKPTNTKKLKRVVFRDQLKIKTNNMNSNSNYVIKNVRLPLVDVIEVESYKKYYSSNEENSLGNKSIIKKALKNITFTCQSINNPCCVIL